MPRNPNGVYTLPSGNPVVPGTLIESTWANPTMADLGNEITKSLPRDGTAPMTGPLILSRDGLLAREAVTVQQLANSITGTNSFMPAGAVQLFAMNSIPTGWLECNGAAVSRTTYANLFASIGTLYGVGNGVTTFNLPDLRGQFVRGFDNGKGTDPGRTFGSNQADTNKSHNHTLTDPSHTHGQAAHTHGVTDPGHTHIFRWGLSGSGLGFPGVGDQGNNSTANTDPAATGISIQASNPAINASGTGISIAAEGGEGRPKNVAMVYCIKAYGALQTDGLGSMAFQNKEAVYITGGDGTFTTLKSNTAPVGPTDVVRLGDIGPQIVDIFSDDPEMLVVDKSNPANPILRPQSNLPNGIVKLDANGKIPNALMDPTGYNYQGTWNASGGTLPSGAQLDGSMYYIDVAGTLNLYHSNGVQSSTLCPIGTRIVYVTDSPTLPVPGWYYEPPQVLAGATASQIIFTPAGTVSATDVQAAIVELDTEKSPVGHTHVAADITNLSAANTPFTPVGTIAATNVQDAIVEVGNESKLAGFRNKLINGAFDIWQRGNGPFSSGAYTADRWVLLPGTGATTSISKNTVVDPTSGAATNCALWSRTVSGSSTSQFGQRIENAATLAGKNATFSFKAVGSTTVTLTVSPAQVFGTGGSPSGIVSIASQSVNVTTSEQKFFVTFAIPSVAGKTFGSNNDSFLQVTLDWLTGSNNGSINIREFQLEEGSIATPFEQRPIGLELSLCQRYLRAAQFCTGVFTSSTACLLSVLHNAMRAAPTASLNAVAAVGTGSTNFTQSSANISGTSNTAEAGSYWLGNFTGAIAGTPAFMTAATLSLVAEL